MSVYQNFLRPILFQLDPELAHDSVYKLASVMRPFEGFLPRSAPGEGLSINLAGTSLSSPVGLAAGFDKNAKLLPYFQYLGFGYAEVGSLTARPSPGNPKPRLFRLPKDDALINYMGLNGDGAEVVAERLKSGSGVPLAVNIARTNDPSLKGEATIEDIVFSFKTVKDLKVCYVAINVSCPNTAEGRLESTQELDEILNRVKGINTKRIPIFVKLSPDSPEDFLRAVAASGTKYGIAGYVCGNTSVSRSNLRTESKRLEAIGPGGLSGPPIKALALKQCQTLFKLKESSQQIIGCGGITTGQDAYDFIRAGASAVQIYTALIYRGPFAAKLIADELRNCLERDRVSLTAAIGSDLTFSIAG
jgi:dihydroorotate dehydrogenase